MKQIITTIAITLLITVSNAQDKNINTKKSAFTNNNKPRHQQKKRKIT